MTTLRPPFWIAVFLLAARAAGGAEPLTHVAQVRALSSEQAAAGVPVRVRGVVTWAHWEENSFIMQDDLAGLTFRLDIALTLKVWKGGPSGLAPLRAAMEAEGPVEIEVEGQSHAGGFAPVILPKTIKILGPKPLPAPRPMVPAQFFAGADACERIEARGVVQGFHATTDGWALEVNANPGSFTAEFPRSVLKDPKPLVDAGVCLRGVAATRFNLRGELTGIRLLITQSSDIIVEKPAAASPFDVPEVALRELLPFRPEPLGPHRQLVQGTVTFVQSGRIFYIQNRDAAVRVDALSPEILKAGDRVQVAGFVDMRRQVAGLTGAVIRKIGTNSMPVPLAAPIAPGEILARNAEALRDSQPAEPHDFDGHLITFPSRLIDVQRVWSDKHPQILLTLESGGTRVEAELYQGDSQTLNSLQTGSELQVTGIVQLEYSAYEEALDYRRVNPIGLKVLLRSPDDLVVLRKPSWWTPKRLAGVLAIGLLVLIASLVWVGQLRHQLHRKSQQLAAEMHARRDAAIEFQATLRERNRLAANLHDTLLQNITGLNYQLEACETESLPRAERKSNHLDTARRMVQRAQEDLRGTVWALRALPLHDRTFAEALRALAEQLAEGRDTKITVTTQGELPRLSEFVAGNLLLVAQEAIHNALKHARPSHIATHVSAAADARHITLVVRDDGSGFNPDAQPNPNGGHFGLEGMRERIERLGGKLRIESRPGHGTSVHADVLLGSFDEDLA